MPVGVDAKLTQLPRCADPVNSSQTITFAIFYRFGGGSVSRQRLGQFDVGVSRLRSLERFWTIDSELIVDVVLNRRYLYIKKDLSTWAW